MGELNGREGSFPRVYVETIDHDTDEVAHSDQSYSDYQESVTDTFSASYAATPQR